MTRFTTLLANGNEARRVLRAAIVRSLGQDRPDIEYHPAPPRMSDEAALGLFQGLEFDYADSAENLVQSMPSLDASAMAVEPEPILPGSWSRVVWGRVSIPFELARTAAVPGAPITAPPGNFRNSRYGTTVKRFLGPEWVRSAPGMFDLSPGVGIQVDAVGCAAPGWVAARLWEPRSAGPEEPAARLK